jgi:hypothetical protein
MAPWDERAARAVTRYEDGAGRLPDDPDERQRQLTRMGNAAWAAGLSLLMAGDLDQARAWLACAAERYRESWPLAPPESWGRPIGAIKARLIAGDTDGVAVDAEWTLEAGATESASPIGRYAAALALLVLDRNDETSELVVLLRGRDDFPEPVAGALTALAARSETGYETAIRVLLADFEARDDFLEDVPVADTVLALQALAKERGVVVRLESALLPSGPAS